MTDTPMDAVTISAMSPAEAGAALAAKAAAYNAAPSAPPASPSAARAQLDVLASNPDWRSRYFSGDISARQDFARLTELAAATDETAEAIAGTLPEPPADQIEVLVTGQISRRNRIDAVEGLRAVGLDNDVIRQAIDAGHEISAAELQAATTRRAMRMADSEWVRRYLAGGLAERNEAALWSIILAGSRAA